MLNINTIKRTFVRQHNTDDCGPACLAMIMNYIGKTDLAKSIIYQVPSNGGLSLLDLKLAAQAVHLDCKCVELEIDYLRSVTNPCIIHTKNELGLDHFEVLYGGKKSKKGFQYLVADPAIQVSWISEPELLKRWESKTALWFAPLTANFRPFSNNPIQFIFDNNYYPFGILVALPLLSFSIAAFGIALTWLLQRGLNEPRILQGGVFLSLTALLLIISIFKSLFSFLRQHILININLDANSKLSKALVYGLISSAIFNHHRGGQFARKSLGHIQKMQNALSAFLGVVIADGSMILLLLGGLFYLHPIAGAIIFIYLITYGYAILKSLPQTAYDQERLKQLSTASELQLANDISINKSDVLLPDYSAFLKSHRRNLGVAKEMALKVSILYLLYECCGTVAIVLVFFLGAQQLNKGDLSYNSFMLSVIEAYLIASLMPKLHASFQQIAEGSDAAIYLANQ